jgi:hypothetical protein
MYGGIKMGLNVGTCCLRQFKKVDHIRFSLHIGLTIPFIRFSLILLSVGHNL